MIDIRGLWEHFPIVTALICVGGIICLISSIIEDTKNNKNNKNSEV